MLASSMTSGVLWAAAAPAPTSDPPIGPHMRDEARYAHQAFSFAPAHTAIQPRRQRQAAAAVPGTQAGAMGSYSGPLRREVFGFAPYWELSQNPNWNYGLLSTVAYFGIGVNGDGSLNTTDGGWSGWLSQDLANIINGAHQAGDAVVVVIKPSNPPGGSTAATVNQIVTSETARQQAISNTIAQIDAKKLDGVNVDFEGSSTGYPNVQSGFTTFMTELSSAVHGRWPTALVTVDTYGGSASWDSGIFKIGDLAPVVDAFFIMSYDSAFSNTPGQAGPNAPLNGWTYNDTLSVNQYLSKAPAGKIILGVPYYGWKWSTSSNQAYATITGGAEADTYAGIQSDFLCGAQQLNKLWDAAAASPWAYWWSPATGDPCGGNHGSWRELYYDNADSLAFKYDLVIQSGIRGTGIWALGYDGSSPDLSAVIKQKFETIAGYWLAARDGGVFSLGTVGAYGSMGGGRLNAPIVGTAKTPSKAGYWLVASDGGIFTFGDAQYLGSTGAMRLNKPVVGMAPTPDGKGYWLVAADGGIFTFGDAQYFGSTGGLRLNQPVVGMAPTQDGQGYWLVARDGGVFTFGNARYLGSTGNIKLNQPVVGMTAMPDGAGYRMVASDGGIFDFGDAAYYGSTGNLRLNAPIVGMATTTDGAGYWLAASDGGIFTFGDAHYYGSMAGRRLNAPVVGVAAA